MASLTRWRWVLVNSRSWWWTGKPGMLLFMGSKRVRHNWVTELNCVGIVGCSPTEQSWPISEMISFIRGKVSSISKLPSSHPDLVHYTHSLLTVSNTMDSNLTGLSVKLIILNWLSAILLDLKVKFSLWITHMSPLYSNSSLKESCFEYNNYFCLM